MRTWPAHSDDPEVTMNRTILAVLATAALGCVAAPALAQASDEASLEKRLEDAQQRLEAAAREVAELSAEAGGPQAMREFAFLLPSPRRAMLGINLGGTEANGSGVKVNGVSPGGAAAQAGVRAEDVIVAIDARPVATGRDLVAAMKDVEPGQKVALELRRDGKPVQVTVVARPMDQVFMVGPATMVPAVPGIQPLPAMPPMPPMEGMTFARGHHWLLEGWSDAELVEVTPALGRYFGTDKGVLVARAPSDGSLGLQDGAVIVAIGGREPQSGAHAMRILRSYQPGESVEIRLLRDRKAQTLKATVPEDEIGRGPHMRVAPPRLPAEPPSAS
ncbi:MAG: PDZ domain-containing protein [Gammaproteobacteria bacterium]|nr:PDZ domain-containing protein [Gammaproteobacteria bacterium]